MTQPMIIGIMLIVAGSCLIALHQTINKVKLNIVNITLIIVSLILFLLAGFMPSLIE